MTAVAAVTAVPAMYTTPRLNYDSISYLAKVSLTGERLPVVPVVYALLGRNLTAIVIFQAILGALCWSYLALVTLRTTRRPYCYVAFVGVLLISCSDYVTHWYTAILSDSISLSLLVLLIASIASWLAKRGSLTRVTVIALLWAFTRDTNGYVLLVVGVAALAVVLIHRRSLAGVLAALIAIAGGVGVMASTDVGRVWEEPFLHVMSERVLTSPARASWFADNGMPLPPALRQLGGPYYPSVDTSFRDSPALVSFRSWMQHAGERTYLQYSLVHPWWVLSGTFGRHEELKPQLLSYYGGAPHHWLPAVARRAFLTYRQTTLLVAMAVAAIVLFVRRRSLRYEVSTLLWWGGLTAAGFLTLILDWVGDSWEIGRHSVGASVQVGIGLLFIISIALGAERARHSHLTVRETGRDKVTGRALPASLTTRSRTGGF